ncbi:tRNA (adenosine(37)-N6)-threonylcarbamoyltransferase complex dimerization subunit type 1 TsaB [Flavobacterium sp.]|uniref:tRNA (adenosine(37)-N6)-threonylcarbamoyltransferase complex dimerization subunit type 1 TsaB n=1 Tax=Flavobacterium sp. TaxID=239 RepID=UPI0026370A84|nr:tRNA (adenosine(37)-N6)-threonylcarbamoyltransferase complex dimerization subunit type 1 TsaB [Flavobacterium sp.]MDD3004722.1 tRNA (adenosine(37)-N6)-threonylcarbamoyltransferase complex dimerization subunit type 1 TsaB [Flavobacterium sp.]
MNLSDTYILNIETATKNCSVALAKNGELLSFREIAKEGYSHAEKLHVFIEEILSESKLNFQDLNAVAISQGPGSYTGLRIGVSSAKGLCYALNIPLIAIDTLQSMAAQLKIAEGIIIPMIDARRMEVFSAQYDANLGCIQPVAAEIITAESYQNREDILHFIGDGAPKCKEFLNKDNFIFHDDIIYPSAKNMCVLSYEKHKKSDTVNVAYFEPLYVKDFMIMKKKSS